MPHDTTYIQLDEQISIPVVVYNSLKRIENRFRRTLSRAKRARQNGRGMRVNCNEWNALAEIVGVAFKINDALNSGQELDGLNEQLTAARTRYVLTLKNNEREFIEI